MGKSSEREEEQGRTGEGAGRGSACAKTKGCRGAWRVGDSVAEGVRERPGWQRERGGATR